MKKLIAPAMAAMIAFAAPALADVGDVHAFQFAPEPLIVRSNGQDYTQLKPVGNTNINISVEYDAGVAGNVKSYWVYPTITNGYGIAAQIQGMSLFKHSKSYPLLQRPNEIDKNVVITVPSSVYASAAVGMCQWLANSLRNDGLSNKQIFGQDRDVHFEIGVKYGFNASGAGSNNAVYQYNPPYEAPVRCAKWQGSQIPSAGTITDHFKVVKATMQLKELATLGGACKVKLTTAISTNMPNKVVKYRFQHSSGKMSKTFSVKTEGNKIAVVSHDWDVPNGAGPENGWFRMKGVTPGFNSNKANYSMNCRDGVGGISRRPEPGVKPPRSNVRSLRN